MTQNISLSRKCHGRRMMAGETDSLNLSVAASLMLYEVFNQRRRPLRAVR